MNDDGTRTPPQINLANTDGWASNRATDTGPATTNGRIWTKRRQGILHGRLSPLRNQTSLGAVRALLLGAWSRIDLMPPLPKLVDLAPSRGPP